MKKRYFLQAGAAAIGGVVLTQYLRPYLRPYLREPHQGPEAAGTGKFEVRKTEAEWRQLLTPQQVAVLRQQGTERPFSSPLVKQVAQGIYACAGCNLPLFASTAKFDSGSGWPSFFQPLPNAVLTAADRSIFGTRTEVHCRRCGGHLGHVFADGPPPTGQRYCMNGVALKFESS